MPIMLPVTVVHTPDRIHPVGNHHQHGPGSEAAPPQLIPSAPTRSTVPAPPTAEELLPDTATNATVRGLITSYIDEFVITPFSIAGQRCHGFAARLADDRPGEAWLLSWLPDAVLNRRQAYAAMVLDAVLVDHELDSATMLSVMRRLAAQIARPLEEILTQLCYVTEGPQLR
ncbi:hypothetical protein [Nocardia sp. NBC_01009]|uniref:hypothetical protein n=1 Tax=Nocardia sp. NBC_01009 TaxID=2975996 RepID=UPI00386E6E70|nr:hypothetical protein OHA42_22960 [Nocardia sp. NBC_01009]